MYAFDWHELINGDVIRFDNVQCDDMGTTNHTQLCYSAMYAQKDGISHVLSHWTRIHRGDENVKNTRCSFYPTTGQDEVLCWVHSKMRVCPTCWDYWPSYYAVPTGPKYMRRVNTYKVDVPYMWKFEYRRCTRMLMFAYTADVRGWFKLEIFKSRQIHITYGRRDMTNSYLREIGRYPNLPVSVLFNDKDHSKKKKNNYFNNYDPRLSTTKSGLMYVSNV